MTGIYIIQNLINNKGYIDKSVNIENRFIRHLSELRHNRHCNPYLQKAFNKYGENNFKLNILEECNEKALDNKEKYWIKYYKDKKICELYNITDGGTSGKMPQYIIDKARPKISKAAKEGNYVRHIEEANGMYGKHHTLESRKLISEHRKGKPSRNKGKHLSQKTKNKLSKANKGRKCTEKTKQKISQALIGKTRIDSRKVWKNEICSLVRVLHLMGYSYYQLSLLCNKNPETIRISIRRYEKENNLPNSSKIILLLS